MIIQYFLSRWLNLTKREQYLVMGAGLLGCISLIYIGCYRPLQQAIQHSQDALESKRALMVYFQEMRPFLLHSHPLQTVPASVLLGIIQQQLAQGPIAMFPVQLEQIQSHEIRIQFAQIPFNLFLHWFWKLSEQYHFDIKVLQVQKIEKEGDVQLSITLVT